MDFFNEIMKFGDIFESQETIDELKDISDEIKKYDVYDMQIPAHLTMRSAMN